jgi:uncharacterized membrane protein
LWALTEVGFHRWVSGRWYRIVRAHRGAKIGTYAGGLLIAGSLAFLPGRIMHTVVFG